MPSSRVTCQRQPARSSQEMRILKAEEVVGFMQITAEGTAGSCEEMAVARSGVVQVMESAEPSSFIVFSEHCCTALFDTTLMVP